MWQVVSWMCGLAALSCNPVPDVGVIQSAYEREASAGSSLHDAGLKVLQAKCHGSSGNDKSGNGGFLCETTFISKTDPSERLYFDIVAVASTGEGWVLKSGLCKR